MNTVRARWVFVLWLAALLFIHRYFFEGMVEAGRDLYRLFIPEAQFLRDRLLSGQLPLWNPYVRLGQPFAATLTSEAFYPPHVLLVLVLGPLWGIEASIPFHVALGAGGAYWAARRLHCGPRASAVAGAFAFTPLFTRLAGSLHMTSAMAWSGFVVVGALGLARRPSARSAALLALPLAMSFLCGAPEVVLWQGAIALGLALTAKDWKGALKWFAATTGWVVALCAIVVLPAAELWRQSVRPGTPLEDQFAWSASPAQLLSMFWPYADEKRSTAFDGPDQWLATSLFIGAVPGLLALCALRRRKVVAVFAGMAVLCAVLCLGRHFGLAKLLLSAPIVSGFRHPVKYAFGLSFCIAMLSALGVRRVAIWARKTRPRIPQLAIALVAGLALLPLLQAVAGLAPWREGMKSGALWFGFAFAIAAVVFALTSGGYTGAHRVRTALVVLVVGELAFANELMGHVALVPPGKLMAPGALAAAIRAEPHVRLSVDVEDGEASPDDERGEGEYPRKQFITDSRENLIGLRPYEEGLLMLEGYGFRDPWRQTDAFDGHPRGPYDALGISHLVRRGPAPFADLTPVNTKGWSRAYRNPAAFPRAWVVTEAAVVPDAEALRVLRGDAAQLKTRALLAEGQPIDGPGCASPPVEVVDHGESLVVRTNACARGYLVLSDAWFPGWSAAVNGADAPIHRANFLIRAVPVPAGEATVAFAYRPTSFRFGLALCLLGLAAGAFVIFRPKTRPKP